MREDVGMSSNTDRRDTDWTPAERFRAVFETENLEGEELGAYLREHGLHAATLEQWRQDALAGLGSPTKRQPKSSRRIRELERELRRKEKALAETAALLVLQKKLRHLLEEDEDDSQEPT